MLKPLCESLSRRHFLGLCTAAALPLFHRDPFDRVIVALAQAHGLTVLTSDENIRKYAGVKTLW